MSKELTTINGPKIEVGKGKAWKKNGSPLVDKRNKTGGYY